MTAIYSAHRLLPACIKVVIRLRSSGGAHLDSMNTIAG